MEIPREGPLRRWCGGGGGGGTVGADMDTQHKKYPRPVTCPEYTIHSSERRLSGRSMEHIVVEMGHLIPTRSDRVGPSTSRLSRLLSPREGQTVTEVEQAQAY